MQSKAISAKFAATQYVLETVAEIFSNIPSIGRNLFCGGCGLAIPTT